MQEEVTSKTIAFSIRTTKMTADVLRKAISVYLQTKKQQRAMKIQKHNEFRQGKITVKELAKQNAGMTNIEITPKNIKSFERYARKYGVNYALKKDKSRNPPVYLVFFKGRDQGAIEAAFREFADKQLKKANRPSIKQKLAMFRGMTAQKQKSKVKNKQKVMTR